MRRTVLRVAAVLGATATVVFALASPAAAHVTVNPSTAAPGDITKVAFRVPNEKDSAQTVKLEINIPTDKPIASVSAKAIAGWTATTETTKLAAPIKTDDGEVTEAVSKITWTAAAGAGIQTGQYQEFEVTIGPLPETNQIIFKALQTYSDNDIVRWIEEPTATGEPEHPAAVLKLAKSTTVDTAAPAAADSTSGTGSGAGTGFGIAGVVLGLLGLVVGLLAYRKATTQS